MVQLIYLLFIVQTIAIPNTFFGELKIVFLILLGPILLISGLIKSRSVVNWRDFVLGCFAAGAFCLIGIINNNVVDNVYLETSTYIFFMAILFVFMTGYITWPSASRKVILYSFLGYFLIKLGVYFGFLSGTLSTLEIYNLTKDYVPGAVVSYIGFGGIPRIVFTNDFLIPIFLFWCFVQSRNNVISGKIALAAGLLGALVVVLSFSRYLYVLTAVSVCMIFLVNGVSVKKIILQVTVLAVAGFLAIGLVSFFGYEDILSSRLGGSGQGATALKLEQFETIKGFYSSPIFGQGFGYDLRITGRELNYDWQAEVQWLGFLVKTGMIGLIGVISYIICIIIRIQRLKKRHNRAEFIGTQVLFIAWLMVGLTNPVLVLSTATFVYVMLYSIVFDRRKPLDIRRR